MRLIDADELKKAIEQGEGISWDSYGKDDLCVRKKYIDNAPTVEAIPTELHEKILDKVEGELLACQSNLRPQGEWIPVSERLPEINVDVIVTDKETIGTYSSYYMGDGYWACDNGTYRDRIIAWKPFPEPYNKGGADMRGGKE